MENELYSFVAREFSFAYSKQFPNSSSKLGKDSKHHRRMLPPNFHYEKIYPKPLQQKRKKKNSDH